MDPVNVPAKFEAHSFTRAWDNSRYFKTLASPWLCRSRSPKVVDFGTNRKRVCDFLLVRNSNLGPILHRFGDIAGFCVPEWPHPYSTLILGMFPLHQINHAEVSPSGGLMLFGREIIFEIFQHVWKSYLNVTDRRTDDLLWHKRQTALCVASRGKNLKIISKNLFFRALAQSGVQKLRTQLELRIQKFMSERETRNASLPVNKSRPVCSDPGPDVRLSYRVVRHVLQRREEILRSYLGLVLNHRKQSGHFVSITKYRSVSCAFQKR